MILSNQPPKENNQLEQRSYQSKAPQFASGAFNSKTYEQIIGSGYCIESLEAALWCFFHTDSYQAAVLKAVNLGDDADTTGAIVGQLAGAFYGVDAIPTHWRERLAMRDDIEKMATALFLFAQSTE
jgi:ADP-ribosyl-[dinitrogen reductase] hydrolase